MLIEWKWKIRNSSGTDRYNPRTFNYCTDLLTKGYLTTGQRLTVQIIYFPHMSRMIPTTILAELNLIALS